MLASSLPPPPAVALVKEYLDVNSCLNLGALEQLST